MPAWLGIIMQLPQQIYLTASRCLVTCELSGSNSIQNNGQAAVSEATLLVMTVCVPDGALDRIVYASGSMTQRSSVPANNKHCLRLQIIL